MDHDGVPNSVLEKESPEDPNAERHSIDVAFELLMQPKYVDLRLTIYKDEAEMRRFRQLVVNTIMATDICDKKLKELRERRWRKVFTADDSCSFPQDCKEDDGRMAAIAVETLIQASDVLHTMQPWDVYRQWNEKLFAEMYKAYKEGRTDVDPSTFWFKGEIGKVTHGR